MSTQTQRFSSEPSARLLLIDSSGKSDLLRVSMACDASGVVEIPEQPRPRVVIYVGRPVYIASRRGEDSHGGVAVPGDIDIVPSWVATRWELKEKGQCLTLSVSPKLLEQVAESSGLNATRIELQNLFQIRNPQIEHIGWALKAEAEQGYPSGRLYLDGMATALASELLHNGGSRVRNSSLHKNGFSWRALKQVLAYIEDNLTEDLTLQTIADEIGISISLLKTNFRVSAGMPLHQYVIRRRVERAAGFLQSSKMPIGQVALKTGFAHRSHLAVNMRRVLGISPNDLRKNGK